MAQKLSCKKPVIIRDLASFIGLIINASRTITLHGSRKRQSQRS